MKNHTFVSKGTRQKKKKKDEVEGDSDYEGHLDEDEVNDMDNEEYMESDASKVIVKDDIAVIKTGDNHYYYILKLIKDPFITEDLVFDDYGHFFPPLHQVVQGQYLENHQNNTKDGDIYFLDVSKTAIVSAFSVVGNCPEPAIVTRKRRGKEQNMFLIDHNLHQGLCELVNCFDM